MTIRADVLRGHTDAVILAQLMRRDSYGYEINKTIESLSGGAELHDALTRLNALHRLPAAGGQRADRLLLGRRSRRCEKEIL